MLPTPADVEQYLYAHIPVSEAIGVRVARLDARGIRLTAPLAPNLNHRGTAFGGSISTLLILSAWSLIHTRMQAQGLACRLVIRRNAVEYDRPVDGPFEAFCPAPDEADWARFIDMFTRKGKSRLTLQAEVCVQGAAEVAATFEGTFVALAL